MDSKVLISVGIADIFCIDSYFCLVCYFVSFCRFFLSIKIFFLHWARSHVLYFDVVLSNPDSHTKQFTSLRKKIIY